MPHLSFCAAAILLAGCAGVQLDPFGRPYSGEHTLPPGTELCGDPNVEVQPRIVRGNLPVMPIENSFTARNAQAKVVYRVSTSGAVEVVSVESGDKWFRNHTIIAVRDWKMAPAMRAGMPVAAECTTELTSVFRGFEDAPPGQDNQ
jgi:hypothetical protein